MALILTLVLTPTPPDGGDRPILIGLHLQTGAVHRLQTLPDGTEARERDIRATGGLNLRIRVVSAVGLSFGGRVYAGFNLDFYRELGLMGGPGFVIRRPGWELELAFEAGGHVFGGLDPSCHPTISNPLSCGHTENPTVGLPAMGGIVTLAQRRPNSPMFVNAFLGRDLERRRVQTASVVIGSKLFRHFEVGGWFGGLSVGALLGPRRH